MQQKTLIRMAALLHGIALEDKYEEIHYTYAKYLQL